MPVASLSQVLTASFLPALSRVVEDRERFQAALAKMSRCTSYLLFPAMTLLIVMAEPIFHLLFGMKWDGAIPLFQLLCLRGIFTVLSSLYGNFILSVGAAKMLVITEVMRDAAALVAIAVTLPYIAVETPDDPTLGLQWFLWGQLAASVISWAATLYINARETRRHVMAFLTDTFPYLALSVTGALAAMLLGQLSPLPLVTILLQSVTFASVYIGICALTGSRIQRDALGYILKKSTF